MLAFIMLETISSTTSYLRLWALSLAHSQLAKIIFSKTVGIGIVEGSAIQILIGWFFFINISVLVLMAIDLIECFLHALRLQWYGILKLKKKSSFLILTFFEKKGLNSKVNSSKEMGRNSIPSVSMEISVSLILS
jgi:hypothetical protein